MADKKQYYMSPDGTVIEQKDYEYLKKRVKSKKLLQGYEKAFKIEDRQKKTR
jgi:hypothetical protein